MHIVFLNGSEFRGTWRDFTRALWHPLFVALILGLVGIILILRPYDKFMPESVMVKTMIICSAVMAYFAVLVFLFRIAERRQITAHTLPVIFLSVIAGSIWGVGISSLLGGNSLGLLDWGQLLGFNTILCIVAEIFLASFLLPRIARETGMLAHPIKAYIAPKLVDAHPTFSPVAEKTAPPAWVNLLGERLAIAGVLRLKAEEHYVSVTLRDGRALLLRGRLADAIAQLPKDSGMQIHRSHWVAKAALRQMVRAREGWRLRMHDGQELPIARNRVVDVRAWVDQSIQHK